MLLAIESITEGQKFVLALCFALHSGYNCKMNCVFNVCFLEINFNKSKLHCKAKKKIIPEMIVGMQNNTCQKIQGYCLDTEALCQSLQAAFAKIKNEK